MKLYLQDVLMVVEHGHETLVLHGINKMLSKLSSYLLFLFFSFLCALAGYKHFKIAL